MDMTSLKPKHQQRVPGLPPISQPRPISSARQLLRKVCLPLHHINHQARHPHTPKMARASPPPRRHSQDIRAPDLIHQRLLALQHQPDVLHHMHALLIRVHVLRTLDVGHVADGPDVGCALHVEV